MLFNSPIFLFLFLPLVFIFYYAIPKKLKNLFLFLASLFFYTWGEKELVLLILASTFVDYFCALVINSGHRKLGLYCSLFFNLSILFVFKYLNFTVSNLEAFCSYLSINYSFIENYKNIILPLGISFYTFQTMSYTVDVYRGHVKPTKNIVDFGAYVTLFPQLIAGPIIKYKDVELQLKNRNTDVDNITIGIKRFILGLAKKMLIANNCAFLANAIFELPTNELSTPIAWLGVIAYSLQIYYDFSGYSDMAIGLGKMLGFDFMENFNFPYISKSIREFWQRWHISLSSWFKEYVYFSLGGNRIGIKRTYLNLFIVFFVTGLWHGANWTYIVWGLIHGFFMILERYKLSHFLQKNQRIAHLYVIIIIPITWVFFRSETLTEALLYCQQLFAFNFDINTDFLSFYVTKEVLFFMLLGILFSTRILPILKHQINNNNTLYIISSHIVYFILFILCCFYIAIDAYDPFIYFRF